MKTKSEKVKKDWKCECGFQFAKPGEFRNCEAFVTKDGDSGIICPDCKMSYVKKQK